jgi:hypothetical protein
MAAEVFPGALEVRIIMTMVPEDAVVVVLSCRLSYIAATPLQFTTSLVSWKCPLFALPLLHLMIPCLISDYPGSLSFSYYRISSRRIIQSYFPMT